MATCAYFFAYCMDLFFVIIIKIFYKELIMKKFLSILLVAVMVLSLASCTKPADENQDTSKQGEAEQTSDKPAEPEKIKLTVWSPAEDQAASEGYDNGLLAKLCEDFNAAHPEWDITFEYGVCGEGDALNTVTQDVEKAADVFMYANDQIPGFVEAGAIARLGGANLEEIVANNSQSAMNTVTYQDAVYGVPFAYNGWFMYYDKSKFNEEEIKDLDAMLAKDLGEGSTNVLFNLNNGWWLPAFFYGVGGTMFGEDGTKGEEGCKFNDEKGLAVTNYLIDQLASGKFDGNGASDKAATQFAEGKLGCYFSGSWDRASFEEALGENFGVAALPKFKAGEFEGVMKSFAGSKAIGVNPKSENMPVAVALAVYLGSPASQQERYTYRGVTPLDSGDIDDAMLKAITETVKSTSVAQPLVKEMSNWWGPAGTFGNGLVSGEITKENAKEQLDAMVNNVNAGSEL